MERTFRFATEADASLILEFIRGLSEYERMPELVVAAEICQDLWAAGAPSALALESVSK